MFSQSSDWRKSRAHLEFLCHFRNPQEEHAYAKDDRWKEVLGESCDNAIKRFITDGVIVKGGTAESMDYKYKVTDLREMLKKRSLPASGKKDVLIQRLVQSDPVSIGAAVAGLKIILCSEQGRGITDEYLAAEAGKRKVMEEQVLAYLQKRNFREAVLTVARYSSTNVFAQGQGANPHESVVSRSVDTLKWIFLGKPKILSKLTDTQLDSLRIGAAMMQLLGVNRARDWLPPDLELGLQMDNDTAARMLEFFAIHQVTLEEYRKDRFIREVQISGTGDSCDACKAIANKKYSTNGVPELPYEKCTHKMGCRCGALPVVDLPNRK